MTTPFKLGDYVKHTTGALGAIVAVADGGRKLTVRLAGGGHDRWLAGDCSRSTEAEYTAADRQAADTKSLDFESQQGVHHEDRHAAPRAPRL